MQKREYQSKYSESLVSEAQYLTDIACERIAKREKETLPKKYWSLDKWKKHFRRQIVAANVLLKEYTCKQILDALNTPRGKNIYSLGLKKPILELIKSLNRLKAISVKEDEEIFVQDDWTTDGNLNTENTPAKNKKSVWQELQ